jgi:DNA (cytosine-5)-methyltransferase 1
MKLATVFSGIGAIEESLRQLNIPFETVFACDNGERELEFDIDDIIQMNPYGVENINKYVNELYNQLKKPNYVKATYLTNHKNENMTWYEDIRFIDGHKYRDKIDLLVGGSPCQSFSIIGKRGGLNDTRGSLLLEFIKLVDQIRPKVFVFENVKGLLTHDKGSTFKVVMEHFNQLGYSIHEKVLNSMHYGIPQNRSRLFIVGFRDHSSFHFPEPIELKTTLNNYLDNNVSAKYYLGKKGFEFVTNPKYKNRARVDRQIISTQKANQQFNWNGDFVMEPLENVENNQEIMRRAHIGTYNGSLGAIRMLTPRECLRLMGFDESFKIVGPDKEVYRQAGNSIVVNVLMEIMKEIMKVIKFDE